MNVSAGNILMFVENAYPQDTRVKNECDTLTGAGYQVIVVAMRKRGQARRELVEGVIVYRLPRLELFEKTPMLNPNFRQRILAKTKALLGYTAEHCYFTSACLLMSVVIALRHGFAVIHAHNPPDTLFVVAAPYKLLGKKFVFDHHDLCPELYRSRYGAAHDFTAKALGLIERLNLKLADITIATNETYKQVHIERGGRRPESVFVVRNGPNSRRMQAPEPSAELRALGKTVLCYIGSLNPQDGVDYLLRSIAYLKYKLKREDFICVIMGSGDSLEDLRRQSGELGLEDCVRLTGYVSDQELQSNLAAADICLDPDPSSPLNDVSTWIKIMEYMAFGKPIVAFDLKETRFSAQEAAVYVEPNDEGQFARAIAQLMDNPGLRQVMGAFGRERVERELQWEVVGKTLLSAYEALGLKSASFTN